MATLGGAEALGMDKKIGSIEKGKLADVVIVETQSMNMIPNYDPYSTLVFQANPHNVETTIVNGKVIVENRQLRSYNIKDSIKEMKYWINSIKPYGVELAKRVKGQSK